MKRKQIFILLTMVACMFVFNFIFYERASALDDHGDNFNSATVVTVGSDTKGVISYSTDFDYFKFKTANKGTYTIDIVNGQYTDDDVYTIIYDEFYDAISSLGPTATIQLDSNKTYYVVVFSVDRTYPSDYYLSIKLKADVFESATTFQIGDTVSGNISGYSDEDYYKFTTNAKGIYSFEFDKSGHYGPSIVLYDSSKNIINYGSPTDYLVNEELQANSTYYLWVGGYSGSDPFPIAYSIKSSFTVDDYGNTFGNAYGIPVDAEVSGTIGYKKDIDILKFVAPKNDFVKIQGSSDQNISVKLYDTTFSPIDSIDNGFSLNINHSVRITEGKTYYIGIGGDYLDSVGAYKLTVSGINDDYGNDFNSAFPIQIGDKLNGNIEVQDDTDVFSFETNQNGYYVIDCTGDEIYGYLYDENGVKIGNELRCWGHSYEPISVSLEANKKYYIKINNSAWACNYNLSVKEVYDDYGNDKSVATQVNMDSPVNGIIEIIGDSDYFSFKPDKSGLYKIVGTRYDEFITQGFLYDDKGNCLSKGSGGYDYNFYLSQYLKKGETYYINICSAEGFTYNIGEYGFLISFECDDDYGNYFDSSQPMQIGVVTSGAIEYTGDIDCFSFTPSEDGSYVIYGTGKHLAPFSYISGCLYDEGGAKIMSGTAYFDRFIMKVDLVSNHTYYIKINNSNGTGEYLLGVYPNSPIQPALIQIDAPDNAVIPDSGSINYFCYASVKNQFGDGTAAIINWSIVGNTIGVSIDKYSGRLTVGSSASVGKVIVKAASRTLSNTYEITLTKQIPPIELSGLYSDKMSPQTVGNEILFIASATGGSQRYYQFLINDGSGWVISQSYSLSEIFRWVPVKQGTYKISLWVKDAASTSQYDQLVTKTYTITSANGAVIVRENIPATMAAGQSYTVSVTMVNTGLNTWTAAANYKLGAVGNSDPFATARQTMTTGEAIGFNHEKTFTFTMKAPSTPGTYTTDWQMLKEGEAWFGQALTKQVKVISAQPNDAVIVSDTIPANMRAGQSYTVSVTLKNTGSNTWTAAANYKLGAVGNSDPFTTARQNMASSDSIGINQEKTFTFIMKAPSTPGTYTTDWQMLKEGVAWFGKALSKQVTVTIPQNDAVIVRDTIPTDLIAGQSYTVSVTLKNTGLNTWTAAANYKLGAVGNSDLFATARQTLTSGESIEPNQEKTFTFTMKAPSTPGTYATDWQMLKEGVAWFGGILTKQVDVLIYINTTTPAEITSFAADKASPQTAGTPVTFTADSVGGIQRLYRFWVNYNNKGWTLLQNYSTASTCTWTPAVAGEYKIKVDAKDSRSGKDYDDCKEIAYTITKAHDAVIVSDTIPANMTAGQSYTVSVTLKNTGSNTWTTATNYKLGAVGNSDPFATARQTIATGEAIGINQEKTFTFTMKAPSTPGTYTTDWQMLKEGVSWFGQALTKQVTVYSPANDAVIVSDTIPANMTAGQSYTVSVTLMNTGSNTWTTAANYKLGAVGNSDPFATARQTLTSEDSIEPNQEKTFTFTMKAPSTPGTYTTDWQMLKEGVAWFGKALSKQVMVTILK